MSRSLVLALVSGLLLAATGCVALARPPGHGAGSRHRTVAPAQLSAALCRLPTRSLRFAPPDVVDDPAVAPAA
ncbi:hypothetical protein, partial [Streptomyces sp. CT34]|uniref:hypothetical protein n=1 Tax=Streptomyces sp. CT34 TaxID=1553907 RepID=UPI0019D6F4B0